MCPPPAGQTSSALMLQRETHTAPGPGRVCCIPEDRPNAEVSQALPRHSSPDPAVCRHSCYFGCTVADRRREIGFSFLLFRRSSFPISTLHDQGENFHMNDSFAALGVSAP